MKKDTLLIIGIVVLAGEEPQVVDAQSPELDDDYRPGDPPKLNDGQ